MKNNYKKIFLVTLCSSLLSFFNLNTTFATDTVNSGTKEIITEGMADIRNAGTAEAYDRAIQDAHRKAIEQALGTIVDERTLVAEAKLISEEIYGKTQGYIEKYEVLEKKVEEGVALVKVKVIVGLQKLKDNVMALDIMQKKMSMPRVLIFVGETINGKNEGTSKVYDVLAKKFMEKQFQIITKNQSDPSFVNDEARLVKLMESGNKDEFVALATKLGEANNAEIAIIGKVNATEVKSSVLGNLKSFQSDLSLQVININDGRVIANTAKNGRGIQITERNAALIAFDNVAKIASDDLLDQILKAWEDILNNGNMLTLFVNGLDFNDEINFTKLLKDYFRETRDVFSKKRVEDSSQFTVKFLGSAKDMATALVSSTNFPYTVKVIKYGFGSVTVSVSKK